MARHVITHGLTHKTVDDMRLCPCESLSAFAPFHYVETRRHPQNAKYITNCIAARGEQSHDK